eukprot:2242326-Ditylum_brightwellii.AAC.1
MDMVDDTAPTDKNEVEEDHLHNCWTTSPQLVYSRFSKSLSALPTESETVITVSKQQYSLCYKKVQLGDASFFGQGGKTNGKMEKGGKGP